MIGKASEIKTVTFSQVCHAHENVGAIMTRWLKDHPDVEVIDIKFSGAELDNQHALIIYKESESK